MKSVGTKLMIGVSLLFLLLILLIYCANLFFLEDYYLMQTKTQCEEESRFLEQSYHERQTDFLEVLRARSAETRMKYVVADREGFILLSSTPEFRRGWETRLPKEMGKILRRTDTVSYYGIIQKENSDKKEIVLAAKLSGDEILFITVPLEHLKTNARISNQFLLLIGSFVFSLSVLITWFFARTVVRPVKELTQLSGRIEHLDFSQRYTGERKDEIGRLGMSLNRTADKLEQTIKDLKEEMILQKRFLASISHELKSPVALIRGYSEALKLEGTSNFDREEFTTIIISESDRLNLLINDLLQLVQMDSVNFSLCKTDFDLVDMVDGIIKKNELLFRNRRFLLQWNHPEKVMLHADEKRLSQAAENILGNAVKHCIENGSISINVTEDQKEVLFEVINDGALIPEEHIEHLFEPFYSAHSGREREKTGSGLGLSIVKSIIEKHGGSCRIGNTQGGVQVSFSIPKT